MDNIIRFDLLKEAIMRKASPVTTNGRPAEDFGRALLFIDFPAFLSYRIQAVQLLQPH